VSVTLHLVTWNEEQRNFGLSNESGESLVSFCALNQLCVMNKMFKKKSVLGSNLVPRIGTNLVPRIGTVLIKC